MEPTTPQLTSPSCPQMSHTAFAERAPSSQIDFFFPSLSDPSSSLVMCSNTSFSLEVEAEDAGRKLEHLDGLIDRILKRRSKIESKICAKERALKIYRAQIVGFNKSKISHILECNNQFSLASKTYRRRIAQLKKSPSDPILKMNVQLSQKDWLNAQIQMNKLGNENAPERQHQKVMDKEWRVTKNLIFLTDKRVKGLTDRLNRLNVNFTRLQSEREQYFQKYEKAVEGQGEDNVDSEPVLKKRRLE